MKICLLGGFGYLGSRLIHDFPYSYEIVVFDNLFWNQYILIKNLLHRVKWYNESILNFSDNLKREISSSDVVIGLAALVGAPLCDQYPELAVKTNEEFYYKIVDYINGKLYFMNTNSMYGTSKEVCTEKTPGNPISLYAKTKQNAENFLLKYPFTTSFRLATLYGVSPGRTRLDLLVNNLVLKAVRFKHIKLYDGDFMRNYISVKDASRAINWAINNNLDGGVYNLGNDSENCTKRELVEKICRLVGSKYSETTEGRDVDKRNYNVSSALIMSKGFRCIHSLDSEIPELVKFYQFLPSYLDLIPMFRNY